MKEEKVRELRQKVKEDYGVIAEEFAASREALWPELRRLGDFVKDGDRILDAGCGNGRLLNLFAGRRVDYIGIDNQEAFVKIAREKCVSQNFKCRIIFGDVLKMPFENQEFDIVACVAVLHHIPSQELRREAMEELRRVLKPRGILFLTAWRLWQPRYLPSVLKYNIKKIFKKSEFDYNDAFIPFNKKIKRYVHAFKLKELRALIIKAGFDIIDAYCVNKKGAPCSWLRGTNFVVIARAK